MRAAKPASTRARRRDAAHRLKAFRTRQKQIRALPKREQYAAQLAALSSPMRLTVLRLVVNGHPDGTTVGDLQRKLEIPWATLSHHLHRLASAELFRTRTEGNYIYYRPDYTTLRRLVDHVWIDCCKSGTRG